MYEIFINILMISIIITYIVLCYNTKYPTPNNKLTDNEKKLLLVTNIYGYIIGILLLGYETAYIYPKYSTDMLIRIPELIVMISIVTIGVYANINVNDSNDFFGKISNSVTPSLGSIAVIIIFCINTIIVYYKNPGKDIFKKFDEINGLIT